MIDPHYKNAMQLLQQSENILSSSSAGHQEKFNLCSLLRKESDEVYLHSQFIYQMIKPLGQHPYQVQFLSAFLGRLQSEIGNSATLIQPDNDAKKARVYKEWSNIDLLIMIPSRYAIIIENKVNACDQPNQLLRYSDTLLQYYHIPRKNIFIVYLTTDGHEPCSSSSGYMKKRRDYYCVTYESLVLPWLNDCSTLTDGTLSPRLLSALSEYQEIVRNLIGRVENIEMGTQLEEAIKGCPANIRAASAIAKSLSSVKAEIIHNLFGEINRIMKGAGIQPDEESYRADEALDNDNYLYLTYVLAAFSKHINLVFEIGLTKKDRFLIWKVCFEQPSDGFLCDLTREEVEKELPRIYAKCVRAVQATAYYSRKSNGNNIAWENFLRKDGSPIHLADVDELVADLSDRNTLLQYAEEVSLRAKDVFSDIQTELNG